MSRLLACSFAAIVLIATQVAAAGEGLARAMDAMRQGNWAAADIAARADGQIARDVIAWHKLRAGQGTASEAMAFLDRHPDWPGLPYLREKSEVAMGEASPAEVRAFFADDLPQTGAGALALADALSRAGEEGAAQATVVLAWRTLSMSSDEHRALRDRWGDILRPHHVARLDMALWKGWRSNAAAMVSRA